MLETFPLTTADGRRLWSARLGEGPIEVVLPNGAAWAADLPETWQRRGGLVYDLRNRGASDAEPDVTVRARGVQQDVDDLEAVRRQCRLETMDLFAHSYVAVIAVAYAIAHPQRVRRLVLIGAPGYGLGRGLPPPPDAVARAVFRDIGTLMQTAAGDDPVARCQAFWRALAPLYVVDPSLAPRIEAWGRCALANERGFMRAWVSEVEPSLKALVLTPDLLARVAAPVLVVHGTADRSAAPDDGAAWASALPDARLLRVDGAAHAPWLEAPERVLPALETFLGGAWPEAATTVGASGSMR